MQQRAATKATRLSCILPQTPLSTGLGLNAFLRWLRHYLCRCTKTAGAGGRSVCIASLQVVIGFTEVAARTLEPE